VSKLKITNLFKSYHNKIIFDNQKVEFTNNSIFFIDGKNGVGKTTLLNIVTGIDIDNKKIVFYENNEVNIKYIIKRRFSLFSYLRQENNLVDH